MSTPNTTVSYRFSVVSDPAQGAGFDSANGINDFGQIVGGYFDGTTDHGFLDQYGHFTAIDVPGASLTTGASGINNFGEIVGNFFLSNTNGVHGFINNAGAYTQLDFPGATLTEANGVNDLGQVVGLYEDAANNRHGYLYDHGTFTSIDVPGATFTEAMGINDRGQIVGDYRDSAGVHGFLDTNGTFTAIDVPGANGVTAATGINNLGQIVGHYNDGTFIEHGFVETNGKFATFDVPGGTEPTPHGINDFGQIVGDYFKTNPGGLGSTIAGFLATPRFIHQHGPENLTAGNLSSAVLTQPDISAIAAMITPADLMPFANPISDELAQSVSMPNILPNPSSAGIAIANLAEAGTGSSVIYAALARPGLNTL